MCVGSACQIISLLPERSAVVRLLQREISVSLLTLDEEVREGDWLLVHSGFALSLLSEQEAHELIEMSEFGRGVG